MRLLTVILAIAVSASAVARERVRLVSNERHEVYLSLIPQTDAEWINALKSERGEEFIFYTKAEMPQAHQDRDAQIQGIQPGNSNTGGQGNANQEFPWKTTAGLDRSDNARVVTFMVLPKEELPVVYYYERLGVAGRGSRDLDDGGPGTLHCIFPVGTVFGEIITITDGKALHTVELRVRIREENGWHFERFVPYRTPAELISGIETVRSNLKDDSGIDKILADLRGPGNLEREVVEDRNHPVRAFKTTAVKDVLPDFSYELVHHLLGSSHVVFKAANGTVWRKDGDVAGYAPTTKSSFHIVPRHFAGHILNGDCMQCHKDTLRHQREFDQGREWYGRLRGFDNILSWHPFAPSSIGSNRVIFRKEFTDAGILMPLDEWNKKNK